VSAGLARSWRRGLRAVAGPVTLALLGACGGEPEVPVVTFPGSAVGAEARVLERQLARFAEAHPEVPVEVRVTPDAADQRHQLYVQWLNAGAPDPDVLQLDVIWTAELAAAGWLLPLDERLSEELAGDLFPGARQAARWEGRTYAVPWFVDVGMLYWRTDLLDAAPASLEALAAAARSGDAEHGFVWQGARYEGLVTVFLEVLGGFGGTLLDARGRPAVDSEPGRRALRYLRDALADGATPREVLTWREEQTRYAFQNGRALLMRNWPYAAPLLADPEASAVAGRFAVAPVPGGQGGEPTAALGGQQLAVSASSDAPDAAWALVEYLSRPEQMRERAAVAGQYPARRSLYEDGSLEEVLAVPPARAARIIAAARPRPVTPHYARLSRELQIPLHRALSGQEDPGAALRAAARAMETVLSEPGAPPSGAPGP